MSVAPAHGRYRDAVVDPGERVSVLCDQDYRVSSPEQVFCVTDSVFRVGEREEALLPTCKRQLGIRFPFSYCCCSSIFP